MLTTPEQLAEAALPSRLAEVLPRWLREVPLYQKTEQALSFPGDGLSLDDLRRLPFITKQDLRRGFPRNWLPDGVELEDLLEQELVELEHTSGTSQDRTPLLLGRGWWAAQEDRALRLNPFIAQVLEEHPQARRVTISSPVCSGDICYTGVPPRSERIVGNALFVSLSRFPFLWGETDLARIAMEAQDWQPQFLDVDPVYGVVFALYCERRGIRLPSLRFILCSYEFLSLAHRRILQRVFGVPVFNLYGSTETGHLLTETEDGQMRPSHETAFLEVPSVDHGGIGELVVTTLTNDYMPLIRYRIGDLVERREQAYCTRYIVHGRVADSFASPDGARVTPWQIDQCLAGLNGIAHYRFSEQSSDHWSFRFVPDTTPPTPTDIKELETRLKQLLGPHCQFAFEESNAAMPENSGKFRLCHPLTRHHSS